MNADGMKAVQDALSSAADGMNVGATIKASLMAIMDPVSKSLLGG